MGSDVHPSSLSSLRLQQHMITGTLARESPSHGRLICQRDAEPPPVSGHLGSGESIVKPTFTGRLFVFSGWRYGRGRAAEAGTAGRVRRGNHEDERERGIYHPRPDGVVDSFTATSSQQRNGVDSDVHPSPFPTPSPPDGHRAHPLSPSGV